MFCCRQADGNASLKSAHWLSHFLGACSAAKSCLVRCDLLNRSSPGFLLHGMRILPGKPRGQGACRAAVHEDATRQTEFRVRARMRAHTQKMTWSMGILYRGTGINLIIIKNIRARQLRNFCVSPDVISEVCCCLRCCAVTESYLTLCDPMDCSTLGFLVLHCLSEFVQICVSWVGDAI